MGHQVIDIIGEQGWVIPSRRPILFEGGLMVGCVDPAVAAEVSNLPRIEIENRITRLSPNFDLRQQGAIVVGSVAWCAIENPQRQSAGGKYDAQS